MPQLPGSPAYGLALSDPPPERAGPRPASNRIVMRVKSIVQRYRRKKWWLTTPRAVRSRAGTNAP